MAAAKALFVCFALLPFAASAQQIDTSADDSHTALSCILDGAADANVTIAACTKLIASGQLQNEPEELAEVYGRRGGLLMAQGKKDLALADFNQEIALNPTSEYAHADRGEFYYRQKQYALALADYDAAVKLNPMNADTLYVRGVIKSKLGDKPGADADIAASAKLDPSAAVHAAVAGFNP